MTRTRRCPDCGAPMEGEQLAEISGLGRGNQYDCSGCGAEWISESGRKGLRRLSLGDLDVVSYFEQATGNRQ